MAGIVNEQMVNINVFIDHFVYSILSKDLFNPQCLPLHIGVLIELKMNNGKQRNKAQSF